MCISADTGVEPMYCASRLGILLFIRCMAHLSFRKIDSPYKMEITYLKWMYEDVWMLKVKLSSYLNVLFQIHYDGV